MLSGKAFEPAGLHAMEEPMFDEASHQGRMDPPGLDLMMEEV